MQRLEALEAERQKRMAGEDIDEVEKEPEGGYAKRRAKRKREELTADTQELTGDCQGDLTRDLHRERPESYVGIS